MVITCIALSCVTGRNPEVWSQAAYSLLYLMNWARAITGAGFGPLGHTWSLSVEEQFYLLWPLLMILCPARHRLKAAIGFVVVLIAWRIALVQGGAPDARLYNGFDTRAGALLAGCVLGLVFCGQPAFKVPIGVAALSFAALLLAFRFGFDGLPLHRYWDNLASTLVSIAVLLSAREGLFQRVLSYRPLVFTGRISYGLYLWHPIAMFVAMPVAFRTDVSPTVNHVLQFGVFVLSYVLALLSWYFIELPFLSLKPHSKLGSMVGRRALIRLLPRLRTRAL